MGVIASMGQGEQCLCGIAPRSKGCEVKAKASNLTNDNRQEWKGSLQDRTVCELVSGDVFMFPAWYPKGVQLQSRGAEMCKYCYTKGTLDLGSMLFPFVCLRSVCRNAFSLKAGSSFGCQKYVVLTRVRTYPMSAFISINRH